MKHILRVWLLLTLCVPSVFCGSASAGEKSAEASASETESAQNSVKNDMYKQMEIFSDAVSAVQHDYVETLTAQKIIYGAMEGMLSSLDPYSQFMDQDNFKELQVETEGQFGGLGIEITIRDKLLTIITPLDGTPAAAAGLKAMDRIVKIDNEITKDMSLTEAVKRMRGKPGTSVVLTILREHSEKFEDVTIVRDIIKIKAVRNDMMLDDHIAYVKLTDFSEKTKQDLDLALEQLSKAGMDSLILDLRNNPGGLLVSSVDVVSEFIPSGQLVVSTKGRDPSQNAEFRARGKSRYRNLPLIVMINNGSASASEIVAGAIQDLKRGILLGTKSFGKGSVQTVIPLRDGSALRLTTAKYYTPSGRTIHEIGVSPDVNVEFIPPAEKNAPSQETPPKDIFEKIDKQADAAGSEPDASVSGSGDNDSEPHTNTPDELLAGDNQLQAALDLMRGIRIYRTMNGTGDS